MALFNFGRKGDSSNEYSIEDIPVFSSLTPAERKIIQKRARLVEYKRGDIVYQEGTPSEAFYVVISGRFRVFSESRSEPAGKNLFFLYRGDHFGEISLLTDKRHSASVEAKSDGHVLKLDKEDFLKLVKEIPAISLHLSRSLGHRLTKSDKEGGMSREVKIVGLYSTSHHDEAFHFWLDLSAQIYKQTSRRVIVVDFVGNVPASKKDELQLNSAEPLDLNSLDPGDMDKVKRAITKHPDGFFYLQLPSEQTDEAGLKKIATLLRNLIYHYDYLMLRLLHDVDHLTFQLLKQTDLVYVYSSPSNEDLAQCGTTLAEFQQSFGFGKNEIKLIVHETSKKESLTYEQKERTFGVRIFTVMPCKDQEQEGYYRRVKFLSRDLSGRLVGLALGSGAAYGLSHIGILRMFEKENIPIDIISGASIGALIGAFYSAGFDSKELEKVAKSINKRNAFFKLIGFRDLSIAHRGFIKGNKIVKYLESYLGDLAFRDLKIPLRIVAANLFNSEEVIFEAGRVVEAIRASISIPGIFRPYYYRGDYLIDGGVIDPLPVKVLANLGVKKIIAVNVLASAKDRRERSKIRIAEKQEELRTMARENVVKKGISGSIYRLNKHYSVNIFNVIMNTIQFMEYELAETAGE